MPSTGETVELDAEYRLLREGAGFLERPASSRLVIRGPDAAEYLQGQITNDVEALQPGRGCYAALLDRKGHVRADLRVLRDSEDEFLLDAEAPGAEPLARHLATYLIGRQVEVAKPSPESAFVSVIGPAAVEVTGASALTAEHAHGEDRLGEVSCRAVATDVGVDLICAAEDTDALAATLRERGAEPVAEAAAEIVRVESGRPRFGHEITDQLMPAEAGIVERAVDFSKGCYIGQEPVARLHYKGKPNRHLRGLLLGAPAAEGDALHLGERPVGALGTVCLSPALGWIALAVIRREAEPGATVSLGSPHGPSAEVVELPFPR